MDENTCTGGCACQRAADDRGSVSRRGVLAGSAAAVAVMALGACASPEETSGEGAATSSAPPSQTPTSAGTPTAQESPGEASPAGVPVAGTDDFPVGGGVVVKTDNGPVVITHPTDTEFLAFDGTCPHAGCPVTEVLENTIICNCHGSTYDGSTGDRLEGPAPTGLQPVPIQVAGGEIFLT